MDVARDDSTPPLLLLPEALGFVPQLLLDDIINIANDAVLNGIKGLEAYLQGWADQRSEKYADWDGTSEIETGLAAVETLLEHHTDIAFDFFEAWSLRNIFAIPNDLPYVLPHQDGLDVTQTPEKEQELMDELEELRAKLDDQRKIKRLCRRAQRISVAERKRAAQRRERLSILDSPSLDVYLALPDTFSAMYDDVARLGTLEPSTVDLLSQFRMTEPGKRQWETSEQGYIRWAIRQLLAKGRISDPYTTVEQMKTEAEEIGKAEHLRMAAER